MAIETATYISDLNVSNPPGSDPVGQADDHLRLLKSVIKSTFPNITGPVSSTQAQLNYGPVPTGGIIMWSGSILSVPTGWALCNGGTYAKTDGSGNVIVPDLRDRFIVGAGSTYAVAATGGATSNTPTITVTNQAVALTEAQLPAHTHTATVTDPGHNHTITDPGHTHTIPVYSNALALSTSGPFNDPKAGGTATAPSTNSSTTGITINNRVTGVTVTNSNTGSGATHVHANTAVSSSVPTLPPYYALAFIYKL